MQFNSRPFGAAFVLGIASTLLVVSCTSSEGSGDGENGGSAGDTMTGGAGGAGATTGGNGATAGTATGGATTGGATTGGATTGGATTGGATTGGATTGGTDSGGSGTGAMAGIGGVTGGTGAAAGMGGAMGGTGGSADDGDTYVSGVTVTVHPNVRTILVVTWTQTMAAEQTWLEFTFETGSILTSRAKPGATGAHRDVVLGVPGQTPVTIRVVSSQGGVRHKTRDYMGTTGAIPSGLPVPTIVSYDATGASPERYLFGAVEDSTGGGDVDYYRSPSWLFVMDRKGRMLWYYTDATVDETFGFVRIARDGEYIWSERRPFGGGGTRGVVKMTLDREYFETVAVANLADCIDVTDDGALLYDNDGTLMERSRAGQTRTIWSCQTALGVPNCYSNTVNWVKATNTVLMSFPEPNRPTNSIGTIVEIDRANGTLVAKYGAGSGAYTFAAPLSMPPTAWNFGFQHFPNINAAGNLMVSSHMPGYERTDMPVANQHAFLEFSIDRTAKRLTEVWRYTNGPEWAHAKGMAVRLPNGNTLANYGTGGVIREITPDKRTVFNVKFDTPGANDFYNKMV
ncbi:MAG TPA: hypothetical protein VF103_08600, partial [Polyangiaceae bacterium]